MSDFAEWEATEWRARQGAADAANDEGEMREITIAQVRANAAAKVAKAAVEASRIVARGVARWRKAAGLNKWTGAVRGDREAGTGISKAFLAHSRSKGLPPPTTTRPSG